MGLDAGQVLKRAVLCRHCFEESLLLRARQRKECQAVLILGTTIPFQELSIKFLDLFIGKFSPTILRYEHFEIRK